MKKSLIIGTLSSLATVVIGMTVLYGTSRSQSFFGAQEPKLDQSLENIDTAKKTNSDNFDGFKRLYESNVGKNPDGIPLNKIANQAFLEQFEADGYVEIITRGNGIKAVRITDFGEQKMKEYENYLIEKRKYNASLQSESPAPAPTST